MATYYKYADREASSQVNWAEITTNMVDSLNEAQAIREAKRKAIDDATAELGTTLSEAPQGDHKGLNEFAMTYANNAQQMRLMQDKLLKSGQLKLRDYNIGRANLTEGTTQLFNLGKKYQKAYGDRMKNFEIGENSLLDADIMGRFETFANFSNHEAYINPTNGQVSVGKLIDKEIGGKTVRTMDRTPGSFTTVQQLNFSLSQEIKKYKLDGLDAEVGKFAKNYVETFGPNFSIDDVRQMPEYEKMVDDMVRGQVQIPNGVGSILKDYVGGYNTVFNKEDQDENSILMIEDPQQPGSGKMVMDVTSEMGKKQQKKAEEFLRRHIEKQLSRKETKTEPRQTSESSKQFKDTLNKQNNAVDIWNKIYSAKTLDQKNKYVNALLSSPYAKESRNPLTGINFSERKIGGTNADPVMEQIMEVSYLDSNANRVGENAIVIGKNPTATEWSVFGGEVHGVVDEVRRMKGLPSDATWGGSVSGAGANRGSGASNVQKVQDQVRNYIGGIIRDDKGFVNKTDNEIATQLQGQLGNLGFSFDTDNTPYNDVLVTYPGGTKPYVLEVGSKGSKEKTEAFLNFILPKITKGYADLFIQSGIQIGDGAKESAGTKADDINKTGGTSR